MGKLIPTSRACLLHLVGCQQGREKWKKHWLKDRWEEAHIAKSNITNRHESKYRSRRRQRYYHGIRWKI